MQDIGLRQVIAALRSLAGDEDVFKVIEADEILEKLPENSGIDKQRLGLLIRDLKGMGYLEVKYFTPDEYCLHVSGRADDLLAPEQEAEDARMTPSPAAEEGAAEPQPLRFGVRGRATKQRLGVFFAAFLGGMLGGMIVAAVAVILQKFAL